jgi:hypothetical protein
LLLVAGAPLAAQCGLSKEYIRLGGRVIAIENASPTPMPTLSASASTVTITAPGSPANGLRWNVGVCCSASQASIEPEFVLLSDIVVPIEYEYLRRCPVNFVERRIPLFHSHVDWTSTRTWLAAVARSLFPLLGLVLER